MNLHSLNEKETLIVEQFFHSDTNQTFQNPVFTSFFEEQQHLKYLVQALKGNQTSLQLLNSAFKKHYFRMRFINYISSTIRYAAIGFIRKMKKIKERNPLLMDNIDLENNSQDELLYIYSPCLDHYFTEEKYFTENIEDELLYYAWTELSAKQKQVIMLSYVMSYQDTEIARFLKISPQAVFNNRKRALIKLKTFCTNMVGEISG
ncbi:sigma-70 family RNA polymerase sigma factor [Paenibacillus sp. FSL M7-0896]|uniref:RNA polymerase sigma factor n=1 Tax=unclassified Paenibacillus TaxID=185978 RepID=UPI0030DA0669